MDRKFILTSLGYAIVGMTLGILMAATKNHGQMVTHAHIMLAGSVVSFLYGLCHKLWLNNLETALSKVQFYMHQVGVALMSLGLFLLYGNFVAESTIDPLLSISSVLVLGAMIIMKVLFIKHTKST
jgi:hypothetical protein